MSARHFGLERHHDVLSNTSHPPLAVFSAGLSKLLGELGNRCAWPKEFVHHLSSVVTRSSIVELYKFLLPRLGGGTPTSDWMSCGKTTNLATSATRRLDTLTAAMLSSSARVPKLKCCAAESRAMVPIASDDVRAHLNRGDPNESTILLAMTELHSCYQCLSTGQGASLPEHSRRFASLYVALETAGVEPSLFFQELAEMDGCQPALSWTYRDEEFGGTVFAGVAEVRRAASSSSLDVSGMREKIIWLRWFIPLVTCVDSGLTRNKSAINTHEHSTCTSTHTVDLNVRGRWFT